MWSVPTGQTATRWRARQTLVMLSFAALASCRAVAASPAPADMTTVPLLVERGAAPLLNELITRYPGPGYLLTFNIQEADAASLPYWLTQNENGYALMPYTLDRDGRDRLSAYWATPIGEDALAFIASQNNALASMTITQARALFSGVIAQWADLEGESRLDYGSVHLIASPLQSGASRLLQSALLGDLLVARRAQVAFTPSQMIERVATDHAAVGYVPLSWLNTMPDAASKVRIVALDGVMPSISTIRDYPLRAPLVFIGSRAPDETRMGSAYSDFFAWVQSNAGQEVVSKFAGGL